MLKRTLVWLIGKLFGRGIDLRHDDVESNILFGREIFLKRTGFEFDRQTLGRVDLQNLRCSFGQIDNSTKLCSIDVQSVNVKINRRAIERRIDESSWSMERCSLTELILVNLLTLLVGKMRLTMRSCRVTIHDENSENTAASTSISFDQLVFSFDEEVTFDSMKLFDGFDSLLSCRFRSDHRSTRLVVRDCSSMSRLTETIGLQLIDRRSCRRRSSVSKEKKISSFERRIRSFLTKNFDSVRLQRNSFELRLESNEVEFEAKFDFDGRHSFASTDRRLLALMVECRSVDLVNKFNETRIRMR